MHKSLILTILGVAILILIAVAAFLFLRDGGETPDPGTNPGVSFPGSTDVPGGVGGESTIPVPQRDGEPVNVFNFIDNGITIEDPANEGVYFLAGSSGVCTEDGTCPYAGPEAKYTIAYFSVDHSFVIGITDEPIAEVRIAAEQRLKSLLGITEQEMCNLKYSISTTSYVNKTFGGRNLGFSFCPNSVALPK